MIDTLLEGNKKFREGFFKENKAHYEELAKGQSPSVLWIGCSDSRLQTGHITQTMPGTLFIQRNIGNVAPIHDWNFATVLEYAIRHLKVKEIVICGHSDCGAIKALDKETDDVYIPLWLNNAMEAKSRVDAKISPPKTPEEIKMRSRHPPLAEQCNGSKKPGRCQNFSPQDSGGDKGAIPADRAGECAPPDRASHTLSNREKSAR